MAISPNLAGFIAALFSIIPTMSVLYAMLRKYDRFFEDRRLLRALLVGLLAGAAITLIEILALGFQDPARIIGTPPLVSLFLLAVIYPVMETLGKLFVTNWHSYRGRRDTPYYAAGIGLAFAAINVFIVVGRGVVEFAGPSIVQLTHFQIVLSIVLFLLLFAGGIMVHGFSTVVMGRAVAEMDVMRAFFYGAMLLAPYYIGYWALFSPLRENLVRFAIPVGVFVYGVLGVRYVIRNILEEVVPARERRRLIREMEREKDEPTD